METQSIKIEISAFSEPQGLSLGFLSSVLVSQSWQVEEFLVDESDDGNMTSLGSYPDSSFPNKLSLLTFQDFQPTTVLHQIKNRFKDPVLSQLITDRIVLESQRRRDLAHQQQPLLITMFVKFTKKDYIVAPCYSAPSTTDLESCAICLEDMSESDALCQPPDCVHLFHEDCFVKWLDRQHDSCPLCRQSPNPLTNKPSKALEKLSQSPNHLLTKQTE